MANSSATLGPPVGGRLCDSALAVAILNRLLAGYGRRDFAIRLWDGTRMPADAGEPTRFTLVLNGPGALRRMLLPPSELALAEAYLDGDWEAEGDMIAAMRLGDAFEYLAMDPWAAVSLARQAMALPSNGSSCAEPASGRGEAQLSGTQHSKARDREAVTHHYDVSNDFYRLWLDRRMVYSCAYFPTGREDLDAAQEAKLDHTCRKLRLRPGEHLLDIGCGWGGLIMHAAERFGVRALGITLSQPQVDLANERIAAAGLSERCQAIVLDYRDLASHGPFDKIVSVGMVEHVGHAKLPEYFRAAWEGLRPGGLFLNHGITGAANDPAATNVLDRCIFRRGAFMSKYVFPDSEVLPVGDVLGAAERVGFEVRDVEGWREHYALTLRHWVSRLEAKRAEAIRQVGERTYRVWRLYMAGCSYAFARARLSVHQSLLAKPGDSGRCDLPPSRADLYT